MVDPSRSATSRGKPSEALTRILDNNVVVRDPRKDAQIVSTLHQKSRPSAKPRPSAHAAANANNESKLTSLLSSTSANKISPLLTIPSISSLSATANSHSKHSLPLPTTLGGGTLSTSPSKKGKRSSSTQPRRTAWDASYEVPSRGRKKPGSREGERVRPLSGVVRP